MVLMFAMLQRRSPVARQTPAGEAKAAMGPMQATDLFDLKGKVAVVTGASSGLGARFAKVLAANGAQVACLARRQERLDQLVGEIRASGGAALACVADMADRDTVSVAFDKACAQFGPVTLLVNNAGIAQVGRIIDQPYAIWRSTMDVNLDAVYGTAQLAAQRMIASQVAGVIINIASILGLGVNKGTSAYAVAKAAVIQLTRALALELAERNIRVNALAPGYIVTDINRSFLQSERGASLRQAIPLGRFGAEDDLDGPLLLLASDAGRFMTGATLVVDGGHIIQLRG